MLKKILFFLATFVVALLLYLYWAAPLGEQVTLQGERQARVGLAALGVVIRGIPWVLFILSLLLSLLLGGSKRRCCKSCGQSVEVNKRRGKKLYYKSHKVRPGSSIYCTSSGHRVP